MFCALYQSSPNGLTCKICKKRLPLFPGWQTVKSSCTGPLGKPGVVQKSKTLDESPVSVNVIEAPAKGPGTELKALLAKIGINPKPTCPCNDTMKWMNQLGVEGCRTERMAIVNKLKAAAKNYSWTETINAASRAVVSGLAFSLNPLNPFPGLVEEAIRLAELTQPTRPQPFTGPLTRNLIMFIFPAKGPVGQVAEWRRNLDQVLQRIDLFNGRRIFAIAVDHTTDTFDEVESVLTGHRCEILQFANRRDLGEVVAFKTLLERVKTTNPNEITYYCHAKGASKQHSDQLPQIRRWADAMNEVLLDGIDDVQEALKTKTFAGAFRQISAQFPSGLTASYNWHYPGTFFWFRHDIVFTNTTWDKVAEQYWGSEAWPGTQCPASQSACLLMDRVKLASLYTARSWDTEAQPALDVWRQKRMGRSKPSVSIVTMCKGRLQHLKQTIWSMLQQDCDEVIVVDYGCPDGAADWIESVAIPKLKCVRVVNNTDEFSCSRARNIGASVASSEYIAFIDADARLPSGCVDRIINAMRRNAWQLACPARGEFINGQCVVTRKAWSQVRGYDEGFVGWGYDDIDFYDRVKAAGIASGLVQNCGLIMVEHDDVSRTQFHQEKDRDVSAARNNERRNDLSRVINPTGYGQL